MSFSHLIERFDDVKSLFEALAAGPNLSILRKLLQTAASARRLEDDLKISGAAARLGLIELHSLGLLSIHRDTHTIEYFCNNPAVSQLVEAHDELSHRSMG